MLRPERWLPLREQLRIEQICYPDTWGGNRLKGMTAYVVSELLADLGAALKLGYRCEAHEDDMAEGRCVCCEVAQVANLQERLGMALAENERLKVGLKRLLTKADEHNALYGRPKRLCAFCPAEVYDGIEGIIHAPNCVIRQACALLFPQAAEKEEE